MVNSGGKKLRKIQEVKRFENGRSRVFFEKKDQVSKSETSGNKEGNKHVEIEKTKKGRKLNDIRKLEGGRQFMRNQLEK